MSEPPSPYQEFDFDEWRRLHSTDPEAFERRRAAALEAMILSAPAGLQPRLRGVQFRVDMERSRARSDLAACLKAHSMMLDSLSRLRDALERLVSAPPGRSDTARGPSAQTAGRVAKVIPFPRASPPAD